MRKCIMRLAHDIMTSLPRLRVTMEVDLRAGSNVMRWYALRMLSRQTVTLSGASLRKQEQQLRKVTYYVLRIG